MAPEIARFPVKCFYKDMVENAKAVFKTKAIDEKATPNIKAWASSADLAFECLPRYVFVNVLGSETPNAKNGLANKAEATLAVAVAKHILQVQGVKNDTSICLLTFYRKQCSLMHELVRHQLPNGCKTGQVQVHTVDSYQG
jgi:superfamily I DNA and/or RNA helicase